MGGSDTFEALIVAVRNAIEQTIEPQIVSYALSAEVSDAVVNILTTKAEKL